MFRRRPACVRQTDAADCGPAVLATIALHHGRRISREALRDAAGTDRVGTNLFGMVRAAEALGFSARAVKGDWDGLAAAALPMVLHVKNPDGLGHFVVLHARDARGAVIADPGRGVERWTRAQLTACWTGYALVLTPRDVGGSPLADAVPPWRRLLALVAGQRRLLLEGYLCAVLMTLLGIGSAMLVQHLVDTALGRGDASLVDAFGLGMLVLLGFRVLFGVGRQYLLAWLGRHAGLALVSTYARHVLHLPMRFFEARQVGEVLSRVQDAGRVRDAISGMTMNVVVDATMVVIALAALWLAAPGLAGVVTLFVPVLLVVVLAHHPAARRRARDAMEHNARLSSHLIEDVAGVQTIKDLGLERVRADRADDLLAAAAGSAFGTQKLAVSMTSLATLVTGAATVAVLWIGGGRVLAGELSLGELLFAQSLLGYLLAPLERLAGVNLQLQDALVAVDRLYQILDLAPEPAQGGAPLTTITHGIELRGVGFRYGTRAPVLKRLDLVIPAGQTVAIVGESGSGKSTLLKLLQRFHDPSDGQILVDGVDLRDVDLTAWRRLLGVVPQEPTIFSGTLRDNVAAGDVAARPEDLLAAVRAAGLDEVVARLPERWDTVIGERGANLSGGQRQRLAIARALLRRPQVLLFDEATSHLDTTTEAAIQRSLDGLRAGRTTVMVAHRLSTIRRADLILVMHDGEVVERGSHGELVARGGRYAALWRAQAGDEHAGPVRLATVPAVTSIGALTAPAATGEA